MTTIFKLAAMAGDSTILGAHTPDDARHPTLCATLRVAHGRHEPESE
mgnify:FL=1